MAQTSKWTPQDLVDLLMNRPWRQAEQRDKWDRSSREFVEMIPRPVEPPDLEKLGQIMERIKVLTGRDPRPGQVFALYYLIYGTRDIIFQASTGYGKSMIYQCIPDIATRARGKTIVVMISPLDALTIQQMARIPPGSTSIGIRAQTATDEAYRAIARGEYSHVIISPELAVSEKFRQMVLKKEPFVSLNIFLLIDEVHCVDSWVTFRHVYGWIWQLRENCPQGTVLFGCSATLDEATIRSVIEKAGFRDPVLLNTTTDRPEIYIDIRADEVGSRNFFPLRGLLRDKQTDAGAREIPKTIIFFDSKADIRLAKAACHRWLQLSGVSHAVSAETVALYYSPLRDKTKERITAGFAPRDSKCRMMLATEAMGMGIEIEGVEMVVQYGSKAILRSESGMKTLAQRMGRAARGDGEVGRFLWFVEPWCIPPAISNVRYDRPSALRETQTIDQETGDIGAKEAGFQEKRQKLSEYFQHMFTRCPREVLFNFFMPAGSELRSLPPRNNPRCCYRCQPLQQFKSLTQYTAAEYAAVSAFIRKEERKLFQKDPALMLGLHPDEPVLGNPALYGVVYSHLDDWRNEKTMEARKLSRRLLDPDVVLPKDMMQKLADGNEWYATAVGPELLQHFLSDWARCKEFKEELFERLKTWCEPSTQGDAVKKNAFKALKMAEEQQFLETGYADQRHRSVKRHGEQGADVESGHLGNDFTRWYEGKQKASKKGDKTTVTQASEVPVTGSQPETPTRQPLTPHALGLTPIASEYDSDDMLPSEELEATVDLPLQEAQLPIRQSPLKPFKKRPQLDELTSAATSSKKRNAGKTETTSPRRVTRPSTPHQAGPEMEEPLPKVVTRSGRESSPSQRKKDMVQQGGWRR